jgi:hypothetical protein
MPSIIEVGGLSDGHFRGGAVQTNVYPMSMRLVVTRQNGAIRHHELCSHAAFVDALLGRGARKSRSFQTFNWVPRRQNVIALNHFGDAGFHARGAEKRFPGDNFPELAMSCAAGIHSKVGFQRTPGQGRNNTNWGKHFLETKIVHAVAISLLVLSAIFSSCTCSSSTIINVVFLFMNYWG